MAKHILYDAEVVVNSVDLSDHVESVEFPAGLNSHPAAAMSEQGVRDVAAALGAPDDVHNDGQGDDSGGLGDEPEVLSQFLPGIGAVHWGRAWGPSHGTGDVQRRWRAHVRRFVGLTHKGVGYEHSESRGVEETGRSTSRARTCGRGWPRRCWWTSSAPRSSRTAMLRCSVGCAWMYCSAFSTRPRSCRGSAMRISMT